MDMIDRSKEMLELPTEVERINFIYKLVKDDIITVDSFAFLIETLNDLKEKKSDIIPEKLKWDIFYALRIAKEKCAAEDNLRVHQTIEKCEDLFCEWRVMDRFKAPDDRIFMIVRTSNGYGVLREEDGYLIEDKTKRYVSIDHFVTTHWSGVKKLSK